MSLKNTDIAVKNWEEKDYQLVEVQEWFEYKGNDREHAGWKYVIVLPRLRYEKVAVKVPNPNGEVPLISSEKLAELQTALSQAKTLNKEQVQQVIAQFITRPEQSQLSLVSENIRKHFGFEHLHEIEQSLENEQDEQHQEWASKTLNTLQQRSLTAKQASLKLQQIGRGLSLQQCMQIERDLQDVWFEHGDIVEGVRALIVDKDKQPKWQQSSPVLEKILAELG